MISSSFVHVLTGFVLVLAVVSLTTSSPAPHFGELNQGIPERDNNNISDPIAGLTNEQIEILLQRLMEMNARPYPAGWERFVRGPELSKRQSRFRQCYFNPVSCFKK